MQHVRAKRTCMEVCSGKLTQGVTLNVSSAKKLATVPVWKQGNLSLHTQDKLDERYALRYHPAVTKALDVWWSVVLHSLKMDGDQVNALSRERYLTICCRIYFALVPKPSKQKKIKAYEEDAIKSAAADWEHDSQGESVMRRGLFLDALFELADVWTEGIDANEYADFLLNLLPRVAIGDQPDDMRFWSDSTVRDADGVSSERQVSSSGDGQRAASGDPCATSGKRGKRGSGGGETRRSSDDDTSKRATVFVREGRLRESVQRPEASASRTPNVRGYVEPDFLDWGEREAKKAEDSGRKMRGGSLERDSLAPLDWGERTPEGPRRNMGRISRMLACLGSGPEGEADAAATTLQRVARGRSDRIDFQSEQAASRAAQRAEDKARRAAAAAAILEAKRKAADEVREWTREAAAAVEIQRHCRGMSARAYCASLRRVRERRNSAAVQVQRHARGFAVRSLLVAKKRASRQAVAAIEIQRYARGFAARKLLAEKRLKAQKKSEKKRNSGPRSSAVASTVPASERCHLDTPSPSRLHSSSASRLRYSALGGERPARPSTSTLTAVKTFTENVIPMLPMEQPRRRTKFEDSIAQRQRSPRSPNNQLTPLGATNSLPNAAPLPQKPRQQKANLVDLTDAFAFAGPNMVPVATNQHPPPRGLAPKPLGGRSARPSTVPQPMKLPPLGSPMKQAAHVPVTMGTTVRPIKAW